MTKTKLTASQVKHVAQLAKLKLSAKEVKKFQKQLSEILDYVHQLDQLKTDKVAPISQTTGLQNVFREDKSRPSLSQEEVLSGAKKKQKGFFEVKAVFEEI